MSDNDSRARFEAWCIAERKRRDLYGDQSSLSLGRAGDNEDEDGYLNFNTQYAWDGWQARDAEVAQLHEQLAAREAALQEAADEIANWGAYASTYFQEKHDLKGCVADFQSNSTSFLDAALKAERERCAKVCDAQASEPECPERATYCAEAIRQLTKP